VINHGVLVEPSGKPYPTNRFPYVFIFPCVRVILEEEAGRLKYRTKSQAAVSAATLKEQYPAVPG
jgi:hypothetical protein